MRRLPLIGASLILPLASGLPAVAHHSLNAGFQADEGAQVTVEGILTEVDWRNPHVSFTLEVSSATGRSEFYEVETYAPRYLQYKGFGPEDFTLGGEFSVEAFRARDPQARLLWARRIRFADGRTLAPLTIEALQEQETP